MSDKQQIFDDARKFSAQFGGFLKAAEAWAAVGSVERAASEAEAKLTKLRAEQESVMADIEAKQGAAAEALKVIVAEGETAKAGTERYFAKKVAEADAIVAKASAEADTIKVQAQQEAARIVEAANKAARVASDRIGVLGNEIDAKTQAIQALDGQLAERQQRLDAINVAIRAAADSVNATLHG